MTTPSIASTRQHRIRILIALLALGAMGACRTATGAGSGPDVAAATIPARTGSVTVSGRVTNSSGAPVADARVNVEGTDAVTRTGADGRYVLTGIPDGPQRVIVEHPGYAMAVADAKFSTKPSDRSRNVVNVTMATPEQAAATERTLARADTALANVGFFDRQQSYRGTFLTRRDIQDITPPPQTVTDVLRTIPEIMQRPTRDGRTAIAGVDGCLVVYVDGVLWRPIVASDLNSEVPLATVAGIESYIPGTHPSPFATWPGTDRCDVLAVWTYDAHR